MPEAGIDFTQVTREEWDAARRMADAVNLHVDAERAQRTEGRTTPGFVAVDLEDGRSPDGRLYESRAEATRHQSAPGRFYVKVGPERMGEREALVVLMYARRAYRAGHVFTEEEPLVPQRLEIARPFIPRTLRGLNFRG